MGRSAAATVAKADTASEHKPRSKAGRKRDHARDGVILDATLAVLAEQGYDGMTIDMVAARAEMARATVYRRWATKADLIPLAPAPFAPLYGMLTDRYGVTWIVGADTAPHSN